MVRTKVFIGNLSFKTREAELAQQFETVAKVVSVNIITRGPRSLGYGFVELESEEDAKKAVAAMDKKDIDGRPINVDLAKTRPEGEDNKPASGADGSSPKPNAGRRAPRQRRAPAEANGAQAASPSANAGEGASPAAQRPRRPRQPRQPKAEGEAAASPSANADGSSPAAARPRRQRKPRAPKAEGDAAAPAEQKPREPRAPRQPRAPREPTDNSNRVPSETSLFVANLPFSLTNESFAQLLNDVTLKFKKAHVVTKRNQKSKGFGFVEFDNQEDQKKALDTLTGKKVEDRELVPKVALVDPKKPADPNAAVPQSPAATPAAETKTN